MSSQFFLPHAFFPLLCYISKKKNRGYKLFILLTWKVNIEIFYNKIMKLENWVQFYNFNRPHLAHDGKTPYERLRAFLTQESLFPEGSEASKPVGIVAKEKENRDEKNN
jgi:hypothetical protein